VPSQRGAVGQTSLSATPASAAVQMPVSSQAPNGWSTASSAKGVYVPAMNRKIIEWSSRFMIFQLRGDQRRRW
jgi:hypothetical protein